MSVTMRLILDMSLPDPPSCMKCLMKEIYEKFANPPTIKVLQAYLLDEKDLEELEKAKRNAKTES